MNNTFGALTQPFIRKKTTKDNTSVLALLMFHDTKETNTKKSFRVLSCVIYAINNNYVCIYYLSFLKKTLNEISVDSKYVEKYFKRILGIGIPNLLMNLLSCHCLSKNIKSAVVLKCPKRMLEYYF